jgi:hypothetical protein
MNVEIWELAANNFIKMKNNGQKWNINWINFKKKSWRIIDNL